MKLPIVCVLSVAYASAALTPVELRCEAQRQPEAVQTLQPRFSWLLQTDDPGARGLKQTAFEISVSTSKSFADELWSSGRVDSRKNFGIVYGGKPLGSRTLCWWRVRVWDERARISPWSEPAQFRMGLISPEDWQARWIGAPQSTGSPEPLPIFRREFRVSKQVASAIVYISGLGQYELRLNGRKVGSDELTPGWTNYRKTVLYNTYDITPDIVDGANVLGVLLGNGMYNVAVTPGRYTKFVGSFGQPKLIFQMHITYSDGSSEVIRSDASWKTHPGPITFSQPYGGEDFDARLELPGWDRKGFNDSDWTAVAEVDGPGGALKSQENPNARIRQYFKPVRVTDPKPGVRVYDLGQNFAGWPEITVRGKADQAIKLICGELLDAGGLVTQKASGGPQWFSYVLKGESAETWHPRFSYYGFRYVQVEETPDANGDRPELVSLRGDFVYDSIENAGQFSSSNNLLNRIHQLINEAIKSNLNNVVTDCPHREKLDWLEQTYLLGSALMYGYDLERVYEKISGDIQDAQTADGLVPEIAPEYVVFPPPFRDSPEWGSAVVLDPWIAYQHCGNLRNIVAHYEDMRRYVDYLGSKSNDGIVAYGLGDWYDIGPGEPGPSKLTSLGLTATATYYADITTLRRMALLLGKKSDAERLGQLGKSVYGSFNSHFYNEDQKSYDRGSQTALAMPLVLGLVPGQDRTAVLDNLIADIRHHSNHVTAGDIGFHYVVSALLDGGRSDVLYDMLSRTDSPSYGYQLAQGATTLTEAWNANPRHSQNHFMLGHAEEWFYRGLAGIDFDLSRPDEDRLRIRPWPVGDVTQASATYKSVLGTIESKWVRTGNKFILEVLIPPNAEATVYVPRRGAQAITGSGREVAGRNDVQRLSEDSKYTGFRVDSGRYRFEVE